MTELTPPLIRVMLVEDEPDIGLIVREILRPDFEVVWARNGLEALDRINVYEPDIALMDLMMPVLDGIDTTRAIKKDTHYGTMPVMFLTARKDNRAVREALMAGGDVYLEKPFDPPVLIQRINEVLERTKVVPRRKKMTVEEIEAHFAGEGTAKADATLTRAPDMPRPITEHLARVAAEPRPRILAVADNPTVLKIMSGVLKDRYEYISSADSETVPDKIIAYEPDILVLRIQMTRLNGLHLAQLIRLNKRLRGAKMIFLSDEDTEELRARAKAAGGTGFLSIPVDPSLLEAVVTAITAAPDFIRPKKRLDYREICSREESGGD